MKVTGINRSLSSTDEFVGERYLEVDGHITPNWSDLFVESHASSFHNMKRNVWIDGNHIVVNCPLIELQSQVNEIQSHCAYADRRLAELKEEQPAIEKQKRQSMEDSTNKANEVFNSLKF
ncbi:TPA: hypothetical protein ACNVQT_002305 [Citrobacter farmeri]